jgi:hypothetical protein
MIRAMLYKLHKWVWDYGESQANANERETWATGGNKVVSRLRPVHQPEVEGLRFSVMAARGGTVVQVNRYDRKRDETNTTTYVIPEGEEVSAQVGMIVSMEMLTQ